MMKYTVLGLALVSAITATEVQVPNCAKHCLAEASAKVAPHCQGLQADCICPLKAELSTAATQCIIESCGTALKGLLPALEQACGPSPGPANTTPAAPRPTVPPPPIECPVKKSTTTPTPTPTTTPGTAPPSQPTTPPSPGGPPSMPPATTPSHPIPTAGAAPVHQSGGLAFALLAALFAL